MSEISHELTRHDVSEIAVGVCIMAIPPGVTEEVWDPGVDLLRCLVAVSSLGVSSGRGDE